ncbi:hypothetical protein GCM10020258_44430 [Sphingomonas yabuuchiae]
MRWTFGRGGAQRSGDGGAKRLGFQRIVIGQGTLRQAIGARGEAVEPAMLVPQAPAQQLVELRIGQHHVEIAFGDRGDLRIAPGDVLGHFAVVDVEFGDQQAITHGRDGIEEVLPLGALDLRMAAVIAEMALNAERVDGDILLAEALQQAEHARAVRFVADFPGHIVVIDALGMGGVFACGLIGNLEHVEAQRLVEHRAPDFAGLGVDRFVDHVPAVNLVAEMPGNGGDIVAQPFLRAGLRHRLGQRGRDVLLVIPEQRMPAQLHAVITGESGDPVGGGEVQMRGIVAQHIDLHLIFGDQHAAFARDDRAITRIVDRRTPARIDRSAEQDAFLRSQIAQR